VKGFQLNSFDLDNPGHFEAEARAALLSLLDIGVSSDIETALKALLVSLVLDEALSITAGTGAGAAAGDAASIIAGVGGATGAGGAALLKAGAGGATSGTGGAANVTGGAGTNGNAIGGAAAVTGGAGQGSAAGGAAPVTGGAGGATGAGGAASLRGGAGGATSGTGGATTVAGGAGTAGNANGGSVTIAGGAKHGSGTDGQVLLTTLPSANPDVANAVWNSGTLLMKSSGVTATDLASAKTQIATLSAATTVTESTTARTLALSDAGKNIRTTNGGATNITVPLNSSVAFAIDDVIYIRQAGAGQVTVVATGGVTINAPFDGSLVLSGQGASVALKKVGTNEWDLMGQTV
jgi:hypothetical protein